MKDLVALVADKDMEHTLAGLLSRPQALGIRPIRFDVFVHPEHDPGCALRGVTFLSHFAEQYGYGLLMFDHEGSGRESNPVTELRESLDRDFSDSPWGERARTTGSTQSQSSLRIPKRRFRPHCETRGGLAALPCTSGWPRECPFNSARTPRSSNSRALCNIGFRPRDPVPGIATPAGDLLDHE